MELVRAIKFPFTFDKQRLQDDVAKIMSYKWTDHYNKNDYNGKWTSVALMSENGKSDSILAMNSKAIHYTDALLSCAYFKSILDNFPFEKTAVRLLNLTAGTEIKPHRDYCLGYEDGSFRLHIPIITNPDVIFILDDKRLVMEEGDCWYINANFTHSVVNNGTADRIHLVIDGLQNEWTDALFYKEASPEQFQKPVSELTEPEKQRIIEELNRMNPLVSENIIKSLNNS